MPSSRSSVLLGVAAIVATFAATFSGVYLANSLQRSFEREKAFEAYQTLLRIMSTDCEEIARLNRDADPHNKLPQLRGSPFLYAAALQNSILLEHMDQKQFVSLIHSMSRASYFGARYQEYVSTSPPIPLVDPKPNEHPQAHAARVKVEYEKLVAERRTAAGEHHGKFMSETDRLCSLLKVAISQ